MEYDYEDGESLNNIVLCVEYSSIEELEKHFKAEVEKDKSKRKFYFLGRGFLRSNFYDYENKYFPPTFSSLEDWFEGNRIGK